MLSGSTRPQQTPKASFASRLFGHDVFVSFALGGPPRGSQGYASDLARRLRERDLSVFFSEDEAPPGEPLSDTLRRALLRSRLLVVIVNRGTLQAPNWVRTEVEIFRSSCPGRPVIPVCLDGSFGDKALSDTAQPWLGHAGNIWLDEQPDAATRGLASDALVARLLTAPRRLRANTLWRAVVGAVGLVLVVLAALAAWQAVLATRERDRVAELRDQALSRQLAAQATASLVSDPVRALLLAVQSRAVAPTPASDAALLGAMSSLPITRLQQHAAAFEAVAVRPDSGALVVADSRGAVLQGTLDQPALATVVPPRPGLNLHGMVKSLAFSRDGRTWAQAGSSREITVYSGSTSRSIPDGDKIGETTVTIVHGLAFSPDGATLAFGTSGGSLRLHELASDRSSLLLQDPKVAMTSVAFSPDGRWLVAGGDRGFLRAVAIVPGTAMPEFETSAAGTVVALAFDAAGERLFAGSSGGRIEVFDTQSGKRVHQASVPEQGALERMAVTPDGRLVVTGHGNGAVLLWSRDTSPGSTALSRQVLLRHAGAVRGLAFAADGRTLVSVGQDGRLFVTLPVDRGRWQLRAGPVPLPVPSASPPPRGVLSPDGRWVTWAGAAASQPASQAIDFSGLAPRELARLTVAHAADARPVADGAELPAELGESIEAGPIFSADSSRIAVQVGRRQSPRDLSNPAATVAGRLLFWDRPHGAPLDTAVALPPGTRLSGAAPDGMGWFASADPRADGHFFLDGDPGHWVDVLCRLAGRSLSVEEWGRYVGTERPYAAPCGVRPVPQGRSIADDPRPALEKGLHDRQRITSATT